MRNKKTCQISDSLWTGPQPKSNIRSIRESNRISVNLSSPHLLLRALLAAPAIDVNKATSTKGLTPLHFACARGCAEVVRLLLATPGINIKKKTVGGGGTTALHLAAHGQLPLDSYPGYGAQLPEIVPRFHNQR